MDVLGQPYRNFSSNFVELLDYTEAWAHKQGIGWKRFRFHNLRHRHAVDWLKSGRSIYELQHRLGHTSVKTTEIYLDHLTPEEKRQVTLGLQQVTGVAQKVSQEAENQLQKTAIELRKLVFE
ncbi:MAG TPA: site-specific integrase [Xanthobacteraceae bacterium]|nr:site-specific integrase [Xanthobacteraceae bacterium]